MTKDTKTQSKNQSKIASPLTAEGVLARALLKDTPYEWNKTNYIEIEDKQLKVTTTEFIIYCVTAKGEPVRLRATQETIHRRLEEAFADQMDILRVTSRTMQETVQVWRPKD